LLEVIYRTVHRGRNQRYPPAVTSTVRRRFVYQRLMVVGVAVAASFVWTPPADAVIGPESYAFGDTRVGEAHSAQIAFSAERQPGELGEAVGAASITGSDAAEFSISANTCSTAVIVASCRISVDFKPTSRGAKQAILGLPGAHGTAEVLLRGDAFAIGPRLVSDATTLDFGSVGGSTFSAPRSVSVTNNGDLPTQLVVGVDGKNADVFFVTNPGCVGVTLGPGETCRLDVSMFPNGGGSRVAQLNIGCGQSCQPLTVPLQGSGQAPPPAASGARPTFVVSDTSWSFKALEARARRSYVSVTFYSALPAHFEIRIRRPGRILAHRTVRGGPGELTVRVAVSRRRRGARAYVEIVARRGREYRRDIVSIRK